ncbi:MAG: ABC transporter permease, partial [Proteobacteria bacterium]|nr:ABC transporter permease [Pseudomonadota bacterium]
MSRGAWLCGRLLQIVPTFLMIGVAAFLLARALPGNAVLAMLGDRASDATIARLSQQLGLDRSISWQLWAYLQAVAHGDFGTSFA